MVLIRTWGVSGIPRRRVKQESRTRLKRTDDVARLIFQDNLTPVDSSMLGSWRANVKPRAHDPTSAQILVYAVCTLVHVDEFRVGSVHT